MPIGDGGDIRKRFLVKALSNIRRRKQNQATHDVQGEVTHVIDDVQGEVAHVFAEVQKIGIASQLAKLYWAIIITKYIPIITKLYMSFSFMHTLVTAWSSEHWIIMVVFDLVWVAMMLLLVDFLYHYRRVWTPHTPFLVANLHCTLEEKGLIQKDDYEHWRSYAKRLEERGPPSSAQSGKLEPA